MRLTLVGLYVTLASTALANPVDQRAADGKKLLTVRSTQHEGPDAENADSIKTPLDRYYECLKGWITLAVSYSRPVETEWMGPRMAYSPTSGVTYTFTNGATASNPSIL